MKLTPYNYEDIERKGYKLGKIQKILDEFVHSDYDCVRVEEYPHKSAGSCQAAFSKSIKNFGLANSIRVTSSRGEVFLVRIKK